MQFCWRVSDWGRGGWGRGTFLKGGERQRERREKKREWEKKDGEGRESGKDRRSKQTTHKNFFFKQQQTSMLRQAGRQAGKRKDRGRQTGGQTDRTALQNSTTPIHSHPTSKTTAISPERKTADRLFAARLCESVSTSVHRARRDQRDMTKLVPFFCFPPCGVDLAG